MSLLPNQTNVNQDTYFFLLVDSKVITTSTITANTGLYDKLYVNSISSGSIVLDNISTLTANISSINTNYISSGNAYISSLVADNINVSSLTAQTGFISSLFSDNIRVSTITADTFNTNTISSGLGFISSFNSGNITTSSITGQSGFFSSFATRFISSGIATIQDFIVSSINQSSIGNYQASNWYLYEAQGDIRAKTNPTPTFPLYIPSRQYDLLGVRNIQATNLNLSIDPFAGGVLNAVTVNATTGNIGTVNTEDIEVSASSKTGDVNIYGVNKIFGDNALYVEGGTTLTGGGIIHGVTIGALRAGPIDTVRIDVLPAGMLLTSATFLTVTSVGATTVTSLGALALAGGSYIEYNSDQHYFKNTTSGNDFTDIYVGNIFPAFGGSANLRLNGGGQGTRGVELSNVKSLVLQENENSVITGDITTTLSVGSINTVSISSSVLIAELVAGTQLLLGVSTLTQDIQLYSDIPLPWVNFITYAPKTPLSDPNTTRAEYLGNTYDCVATNLNLIPNQPIPDWLTSQTYDVDNIAFVPGVGSYRCVVISPPNPLPPNNNFAEWTPFNPTNAISNVWFLNNSPISSGITGDKYSYINVGTGLFSTIGINELNVNTVSSGLIVGDTIGATNLLFGTSTITNYIELADSINNPGNIVGDSNSYIRVGSGLFDNIITSTINVSTINAFNISSITTDNLTATTIIVDNIVSNPASTENINISANLNTFITSQVDTNITGNDNLILQSSNITLIGSNLISGVGDWNYNNYNLYDIGHLTAVSTSISYISTGFLSASNISTTTLIADTLNSYSTNISTIITNNVTVRGVNPYLTFYNLEDQEIPRGLITAVGDFLGVIGQSTIQILSADGDISIQALNGTAVLEASNVVLLKGDTQVQFQTPFINADTTAFISTIISENIITKTLDTNNVSTTSVFAESLYAYNIGQPNPFTTTIPVAFNNSIDLQANNISNINLATAGQISTSLLSTGSIVVGNYTGNSISTNFLSTGSLFVNNYIGNNISTNFLSTGNLFVNNSVENSISSLRISSGSVFSGAVSTLQLNTSSIRGNRALIDRLNPLIDSGTATANLYPQSAGSQIGFFGSGGTNSGGFYNQINVRSTITQVIAPDIVGAFSNNIRVQGNLSTQNVFVSSINNKLYPYTSTLNIPFSSFSITGNQAGTPILLYSNVDFRNQGFHRISQKTILSKNSGGASQDIHANIFYTVGAFPSTPSITDGYSALPGVNQDNASTFTTLLTEFYVSTPTTRNILYYDSTANNYTARLYMGTLFDTYTPQFGINPERIPANIL